MGNMIKVYKCNPKLHKDCPKTDCQTLCFHTMHKEYSVDGKQYYYDRVTDTYKECDEDE